MASLLIKGSKYQLTLAHNYYIIMTAVYFLSVYLPSIRMGILMSVFLLYFFYGVRQEKRKTNGVFAFFVYSIISIQGYIYNEIPISAYLGDFMTQILPMVLFFVALHPSFDRERFYHSFVLAMAFALIIGLYFYVSNPPQYIDYVVRTSDSTYGGSVGLGLVRFQSLFSSTITGTLCVVTTIVTYVSLLGKRDLTKLNKYIYIIVFLLSVIGALLTLQRSSMVCEIFVLISIVPVSIITKNKINKTFVFFVGLAVIVAISYAGLYMEYILNALERLSTVHTAMSDRDGQWKETFANSANIIFGTGLGSAGHHAIGYAKYYITDGGLFKLIAEYGIFGFCLFIIPLFKIMIKNLEYFSFFSREYMIILLFMVQSVGSNTLCFQQTLPLFWMAVGIMVSYNNRLKYLQWK